MLRKSLVLTGLRDLRRRPLHTSLMVLGVALGVGVVVAFDLASESARMSLRASTEAIEGRTTHDVLGGPSGVPLSVYKSLKTDPRVAAAAPVVEAFGEAAEMGRRTVRLLGLDPLADGPFRDHLPSSLPKAGLDRLFTDPHSCLLSLSAARRYGLGLGGSLHVSVDGKAVSLTILGLFDAKGDRASATDDLVLMDVGALQALVGQPESLTRIDLIVSPDEAKEVSRRLPEGLRLEPASDHLRSADRLTAAFRTNLEALSLLALVVGMFLVYNTVTFAVVQRRALFGTLRVLGVTPGQILSLVLLETGLAAALGAAIGQGVGVALGEGVVRLTTQTINDLYYAAPPLAVALEPATVVKSVALGLLTALLAALVPGLEASRTEPVLALREQSFETASLRWLPRLLALGGAFVAGGIVTLAWPAKPLSMDFLGLFCLLLGAAFAVPLATRWAMTALATSLGRAGLLGAIAARTVARSVSRTGVAIAALMTAVSVAVAVSLMIASFRATVSSWLDLTLVADVYVDAPSRGLRGAVSLPEELAQVVAKVKGVASVETFRRVRLESSLGLVSVGVSDASRRRNLSLYRFRDAGGHPWDRVEQGAILVSEPLALKHALPRHGASVTLVTDHGNRSFPVAGVFYDYASEQGTILMSRGVYLQNFDDHKISSIAAYVAPGTREDDVMAGISSALAGTGLLARNNAAIKREALKVFDRTFAVTDALRILAIVVAVIGIWSALLSLQVERTRELATLRALGLTPSQLGLLCALETALMGLEAGLLSLPVGAALAFVLVKVIDVRSFGWTMPLAIDPRILAEALLTSVGAAVLAAVYPLLRLRTLGIAAALRTQ